MKLAFQGLRFDVEEDIAIVNLERRGSMSSANRSKCFLARLAVLKKAAHEVPAELHRDVGLEAWLCARHLGAHGRFQEMREAIRLARAMGVHSPKEESKAVVRTLGAVFPVVTFFARARFVEWRDGLRRDGGRERDA